MGVKARSSGNYVEYSVTGGFSGAGSKASTEDGVPKMSLSPTLVPSLQHTSQSLHVDL